MWPWPPLLQLGISPARPDSTESRSLMLPTVWGQDSTPGLPGCPGLLRAPPGSVCTLAPGWARGQRAGAHHLGGPALLIRQRCTPVLWLLRVVPVDTALGARQLSLWGWEGASREIWSAQGNLRQVPKPLCASVSSCVPKEKQKQCGGHHTPFCAWTRAARGGCSSEDSPGSWRRG